MIIDLGAPVATPIEPADPASIAAYTVSKIIDPDTGKRRTWRPSAADRTALADALDRHLAELSDAEAWVPVAELIDAAYRALAPGRSSNTDTAKRWRSVGAALLDHLAQLELAGSVWRTDTGHGPLAELDASRAGLVRLSATDTAWPPLAGLVPPGTIPLHPRAFCGQAAGVVRVLPPVEHWNRPGPPSLAWAQNVGQRRAQLLARQATAVDAAGAPLPDWWDRPVAGIDLAGQPHLFIAPWGDAFGDADPLAVVNAWLDAEDLPLRAVPFNAGDRVGIELAVNDYDAPLTAERVLSAAVVAA